ncbi:MAG TPA: HNH endonuclease [Acidimicrobiales bacterium]|nr:HNH endonuclease [Acidimicrobiales bacterium]
MPYADPNEKRRRDAEYRAERRAELAAKQREYYRRNRPVEDASHLAWLAAHPETARVIRAANSMNRRAKKWACVGVLTVADLRSVSGPCSYCGGLQETWDHVIPLWLGGTNKRSNLVPCCEACNRKKGRYSPRQQSFAL